MKMKILGIETATSILSLAIVDEGELFIDYTRCIGLRHSSELMPAIVRIIEENGLTIKDIDGLSVSLGPGSFTGLRIGLATAKGLAQALNIPLVGIGTLDGLASNLLFPNRIICPILDAPKAEVYTALYRTCEGTERLTEYLAISPQRLIEMIKEPTIFLGNGLKMYGDLIGEGLKGLAHFAPPHLWIPRASNIARLGLKEIKEGRIDDLSSILPIYIRKPEAEIKWEERFLSGR